MSYIKCFEELVNKPESAAEVIHCLKKHGENVMYSNERKRLVLGREMYDDTYSDYMKRITEILGIDSRERYNEVDKKFNLTMY